MTPAGREIKELLLKSELANPSTAQARSPSPKALCALGEAKTGKAPCTPECAERTITCHTTCKRYLGWKDALAARKHAAERRHREENETAEFYRAHQKRVDKYKRKGSER